MVRKTLIGLLLIAPLTVPLVVSAAGSDSDSSSSSSSSSSSMPDSSWDKAKSYVDDGQFDAAIPLLFDVVRDDDQNADAYNLLGFTHRKTGKLDAALKYYNKALAIDPAHRGAHEYIGEAFLEMGDVAGAKKHLAFLDNECTFGCSEYNMLKESVEKYEARNK